MHLRIYTSVCNPYTCIRRKQTDLEPAKRLSVVQDRGYNNKKDAEKHLERFSSIEIFFKCLALYFHSKTRKMGLGHKRINKMSS